MRKRVAIIICTVLVLTLGVAFFAGCYKLSRKNELEYEDFRYFKFENDTYAYIEISDLSEQGKQKEVLIVPETIDGIKVEFLRSPHFGLMGEMSNVWYSEKLRKIFLPADIVVEKGTFDGCTQLKYIALVLEKDVKEVYRFNEFSNIKVYIIVPTKFYDINKLNSQIKPANINYYYNFENAENDGVYWIDNIEIGERIVDIPPTEPLREGYAFGGWYTEPECTNKWNFETDVMPETGGINLYAEWVKI